MNSFYTEEELKKLNFKSFGKNVLISRKASFYSANTISIGNNVRIDDYCILSGNIEIGNYVHISAYCSLYGKGTITLKDYSGCSPRSTIYSQTDDFSGEYMIGPMIDEKYTNVIQKKVVMEKYTQLGANSIVFPGVTIKEGAVTGAFTLVKEDLQEWSINVGIPAKKIKDRSKNIITIERNIINE
ncbi:MAG: acyltransferase [Bacilli bacterium]|nr:acyltransferase [Bacilli bacterium]